MNSTALTVATLLRELADRIEAAPDLLQGFQVRSGVHGLAPKGSAWRNFKHTKSPQCVINYTVTVKGGGCD